MLAVQMMNDLPDVAGSLFTNQYKAVKIEGKRVKPNALEGTGSVRNCLIVIKLNYVVQSLQKARYQPALVS